MIILNYKFHYTPNEFQQTWRFKDTEQVSKGSVIDFKHSQTLYILYFNAAIKNLSAI